MIDLDILLQDEALGAGNFIYRLRELAPNLTQPLLCLLDNETKQQTNLTVKQIIQISDRLASAYSAIGVQPKDVVSLYLKDGFDYFLHFVALNSIGAIPSLVNGGLSYDVLGKFLQIIRPQYLILNERCIDQIRPSLLDDVQVYALENLEQHATNQRPPLFQHQNEDVIMIGHTSGTTGIPKGVIFTHESMYHGVKQQIKKQKGEHVLSILPHSHGASISVLMSFLLRGTPMTILSQREPEHLIDVIKTVRPDVVVAFPKVFVDLCRKTLNPEDFSSVGYWIATGDANHESHIRKLIQLGQHEKRGETQSGSMFIDNLGSSEFAFAIFRNIHAPHTNQYNRCIGQAFEWVDVAVFDDAGYQVQPYQIGRLGVKAKSVTLGYWNNHTLTEQNKLQGYWLTGDLVYFDEQQRYFHVDRTSDAVIVDGQALYSCQIEEWLLANIPSLFELSVVAQEDGLIAYVELKENVNIDPQDLMAEMNKQMAQKGWATFKSVQVQSAHDYTGVTGKKLKRELRTL